MFKIKHSLVLVNISDLFNLKITQYKLRNTDFEPPRFETVRFGRNSIKYMEPLIWSKLPRHLRMIEIRLRGTLGVIHSFIRSFVHSFIRSFVHSFIRSFVHSFIRSFVHSFIRSFVHSFIRSFVHSFIRSFVHSFIRSFIHSS